MRVRAHRILEGRSVIAGAPASRCRPRRPSPASHDGRASHYRRRRRLCVARELRRLRLQDFGHGLVADEPARLRGVPGRCAGVADPDGDHPARQRLKALLALARPRGERDERGDAEDEAQHAPDDRESDRQRRDDAERQHQRNLVFHASPGHRHDARIVREPGQTPSGQRHRGEENQQAKHLVSALKRLARAGTRFRGLTASRRPQGARSPISRIPCSAASAACLAAALLSNSPAA